MRPGGPNQWAGQIYNADDGKIYASKISMAGPATLKVEGCIGAGSAAAKTGAEARAEGQISAAFNAVAADA